MNTAGTISLGFLSIPTYLAAAVGIFFAAWLTGRVILRSGDGNEKKLFSELLSSPLLPFILAWKLSLAVTDAQDVFSDPLLILYSTGSTVNLLIGLIVGMAWMGFRWFRADTPKKVSIALFGSLLAVVLLAGTLLITAGISSRQSTEGDHALLPAVTIHQTDGSDWDIRYEEGSVVVLNFWASWCPPCRAEMPMLERFAADNRFEDVVFYAVNATNTEKSPDDPINWLVTNDLNLPLLFDTSGRASAEYGVASLPTTFVVDSKGRIAAMKSGAVSRRWLATSVRKARRGGKTDD